MSKKVKKLVPELRFSEFKDDWKEKILTELANVQTGPFGSQLKNEQYITGGTPVVTVEHIKGFYICNFDYPSVTNEDRRRLRKYTLESGDIVFSRVGSVDLSACVEDYQEGWLFSSRMLRVRLNKQLKSKFVSYFLQQTKVRRYIIRISVGSTMPSLNTEILQSLPIRYSTLEEQEKIASFLDTIALRINQLRRKHELLETYKKGVMQKIFSQQIRFKQDDGKPFPDWEKKKLGELLTIRYGKDHKDLEDGKYPVLGTGGVMRYVNSYLYDKPSILIGRKGTIDRPRFVTFPFWTVDTLFYSEIKPNIIPFFLFLIVQSINWYKYNEATGVPSLNTTSINSVKIHIPSEKKEQEKIANFITSIDKKIDAVGVQIEKLEEFKKGLLQKMFV